MLDSINHEVKLYDWKAQFVGRDENQTSVAHLINRIESGYYQTKKVKVNLEVYNLRNENFTCNNLLEFLTHYKLVENASLKYPVIVNNEGQVIDGRHRICKAILQGKKEIDGIQILDSNVI